MNCRNRAGAAKKDRFFETHATQLPSFSAEKPAFLLVGLGSIYTRDEENRAVEFSGTIFTRHLSWDMDIWRELSALDTWLPDPFGIAVQEADNNVIDTLVRLGLNLLIFTGAFPEEIYPESIVGKRQLKNHREQIYLPELVRPRTVGSLSYRIAKNPECRHSEVESTGSTVRPNWRKGHWRNQRFGSLESSKPPPAH